MTVVRSLLSLPCAACALVALGACAAPSATDAEGTVASADRAFGTNLVFKKLATPIANTVVTPIGQREADVVARETAGATSTGPLTAASCVETFKKGAAYIERVACDGEHAVRVWEGGEYAARAYIFRGGIVRTYMAGDGTNAWQLYATDRNDTGKVSELDQALTTIPEFTVTGYSERGWSSTKNWFRLLFDTDGDGLFDVEGVTGNWGCTTTEPTGCDSGPNPMR